MEDQTISEYDRAGKALSTIDRCLDTVFENAPVMMHSIDERV